MVRMCTSVCSAVCGSGQVLLLCCAMHCFVRDGDGGSDVVQAWVRGRGILMFGNTTACLLRRRKVNAVESSSPLIDLSMSSVTTNPRRRLAGVPTPRPYITTELYITPKRVQPHMPTLSVDTRRASKDSTPPAKMVNIPKWVLVLCWMWRVRGWRCL